MSMGGGNFQLSSEAWTDSDWLNASFDPGRDPLGTAGKMPALVLFQSRKLKHCCNIRAICV
jgi:hypothetical protein